MTHIELASLQRDDEHQQRRDDDHASCDDSRALVLRRAGQAHRQALRSGVAVVATGVAEQ